MDAVSVRRWLWLAAAVLVSCAISLALDLVAFPAAWLNGGLAGAALVAAFGGRFALPSAAINTSYVILGMTFGSAITAEVVGHAAVWLGTISVSIISLGVMMVGATWYLWRVEKWDVRTAFFATAPGALPAVIATAADFPVDHKKIILSQTVRLVTLMATVPLIFPHPPAGLDALPTYHASITPGDLALLAAVSTMGGVLALLCRLPAGLMVGSLAASGGLYATASVQGEIPAVILNAAMLVVGIMIGAQVSRLTLRELVGSMRAVTVVFGIGVAVSLVSAAAASALFDQPLELVLLAYLPGAMEGMTILGFILGLDPAFISVHHIVRFIFVVAMLPVVVHVTNVGRT
ncbi:AbrB family transcriptional regulator [Terrihabitans rhizophilus]|uniref:AbrB family transcriptional regulator n=1 Tax=Terrihabitans rhizophilus TaxID=3092662 RepID=A0ABU4RMB6_9HYPH|nr:AbrB family transcriptional regulator [Terrihabitans sp. PJ23]MDX6805973.1 AbrB family transcriptional regulator [Terrihabitans sp. PJ23]